MKKYFFVLCAILCSWATAMAQNVEIYSTNEMKAQPGETVKLSLSMKNQIELKAWSFRLVLPEGIEVAKDNKGRYVYSISRDDEHSKDARITVDEPVGVQFSVYGSYAFLENDGEIVSIDLVVSEDAQIGTAEMRLAKINYADMNDAKYRKNLYIPIPKEAK